MSKLPLSIFVLALLAPTSSAQNPTLSMAARIGSTVRRSDQGTSAHLLNISYKLGSAFNLSHKESLPDLQASKPMPHTEDTRAECPRRGKSFSPNNAKDVKADDFDDTTPIVDDLIYADRTAHVQVQRRVRIAFSSTSTVSASDVRRALAKKCPNVSITFHALQSDYALEALAGTINPVFPFAGEVRRYRFTLINRAGNPMYSTSPFKFSNAINNVCMAVNK